MTEVTRLDQLERDVRRLRSRCRALGAILMMAIIAGMTWHLAGGGQAVASGVAGEQDDGLRVLRGTGLEIVTRDGQQTASILDSVNGSMLRLYGRDGRPRVYISAHNDTASVLVRGEVDGKYENHIAGLMVSDEEGPRFRAHHAEADVGPEDLDDIWAAP